MSEIPKPGTPEHEAQVKAWTEWLQRDPAAAIATIMRLHGLAPSNIAPQVSGSCDVS